MHYNISQALPPEWVTPKNPNPTRDNGLLVVIKGEHCGKFAQRIRHHYNDEDKTQVVVIVAVVKKVGGVVDTLTGEQLELGIDSLCLAVETIEDKKLNVSLMNTLRESARKISEPLNVFNPY